MNWIRNKLRTLDLGWAFLVTVLGSCVFIVGYAYGRAAQKPRQIEAPEVPVLAPAHVHQWGKWGEPKALPSGAMLQTRQCTVCGQADVGLLMKIVQMHKQF